MSKPKNESPISFEQHQKAMSVLEKKLAKANVAIVKLEAKTKKDRQKTEAKLVRERAELDKQRKKDQKAIDKRVAKFEADRAKETRMRLKKETTKWEREPVRN